MAKYISFPCHNTAVAAPLGPINSVLVNVEDITTVTATGLTGANAKTCVIGLTGRAAQGAGYQTLTISVSTLVAAVRSAMTANPGGVATTCSPGFDDIATAAVPNGVRMYWRTATYA